MVKNIKMIDKTFLKSIGGGCNCICTYYSNGQSGRFIESLGELPDALVCGELCVLANNGKMEGCFEKAPKNCVEEEFIF